MSMGTAGPGRPYTAIMAIAGARSRYGRALLLGLVVTLD